MAINGAPVDRWVPSENGLRRWRPILDTLLVTQLPGGGALLDGNGMGPLRLDAEMRRHVCRLLLPDDWRQILERAGVL
jgi:hypothetical protein